MILKSYHNVLLPLHVFPSIIVERKIYGILKKYQDMAAYNFLVIMGVMLFSSHH